MGGGPHAPHDVLMEWRTDDYHYPKDVRAPPALTIISVVMTSIALIVTLTRLYDRLLARHSAGIDDALAAAALVPLVALCIVICLAEQVYGFDRHSWAILPAAAPSARKMTLSLCVFYVLTTSLTKISILSFHRRLGGIKKWFRWTVRFNVAFVVAYAIVYVVLLPLQCKPIHAFWDQSDPVWAAAHEFHCINEGAALVCAGIISVIQDFITLVLPMIIFWNLHMSRHAKIALMTVFSLGFCTCLVCALRLYHVVDVYYKTYDTIWHARPVLALTLIEAALGLICASMPPLKGRLEKACLSASKSRLGSMVTRVFLVPLKGRLNSFGSHDSYGDAGRLVHKESGRKSRETWESPMQQQQQQQHKFNTTITAPATSVAELSSSPINHTKLQPARIMALYNFPQPDGRDLV